ncbi:MAG TPA: MATE family efflux transporter [Steroidobacteraceae bacterium]
MRDLTQGPIARPIVALPVPIFAGMLLQTLYYFVDLYIVSRLGNAAIAGVSAAGNMAFLVFALTQMLGVGVVALISQAVGRKNQTEANFIGNQSLVLALLLASLTILCGYGYTRAYMGTIGADAPTLLMGTTYLYWFLPGLALQFALVAMGSALRGTGIVKPTMIVQALTVLVNIVLAPVLIVGWGSGRPLGVAGADLASTIAIACGVGLLAMYFFKLEKYVQMHPSTWVPRLAMWLRIFNIGLLAGGEFALMFAYLAIIFWIIRTFGATAQAGFDIGSRVMQSIFLPAMAVAFATASIVGENFGAQRAERVTKMRLPN